MYPPRGGGGLDGPPPSPAMQGIGTGASPTPPQGYSGLAPAGLTPQVVQQGLAMGQQIDQALTGLAAMMPMAAAEFRQASQLIQQGFAKVLQAGSPATSPTTVGGQFPGGGFSSGAP